MAETITLKVGNFYIMGFGNGTQLIFVHGLTKTGKRARFTRCQQWRSDNPYWHLDESTAPVGDARVRECLGAVAPPRIPAPYTPEEIAANVAEKAAAKAERIRVAAAKVAELNALEAGYTDLPPCGRAYRHGHGALDCKHVVGAPQWKVTAGQVDTSHDWACVVNQTLRQSARS